MKVWCAMIVNVLVREVVDNVAIIDMFSDDRHLKIVKLIVNYDNLSKDANHSLSIGRALPKFGVHDYSIQEVSIISKAVSKGAREFVSVLSTDLESDWIKNFDSRKWKTLFTFDEKDRTEFILVKTTR